MSETKTVKANIDFPTEDEIIDSLAYTMRIKAPLNAEKVEVCIDGAPWQLCYYSTGFWWYDWTGYTSGDHEIVVRILPFDSRNYTLRTRRFVVKLAEIVPSPAKPENDTVEYWARRLVQAFDGRVGDPNYFTEIEYASDNLKRIVTATPRV